MKIKVVKVQNVLGLDKVLKMTKAAELWLSSLMKVMRVVVG